MLLREIFAVCSEIHTKHTNTMCGQNVEFLDVKPGGTYIYHWLRTSNQLDKNDISKFNDTMGLL